MAAIMEDADRVWVFTEKRLDSPTSPLLCPAELAVHGGGTPAPDPRDCQAIADGSTVFPRRVFDLGLRYDEAYHMGAIWYLWGVVIALRRVPPILHRFNVRLAPCGRQRFRTVA